MQHFMYVHPGKLTLGGWTKCKATFLPSPLHQDHIYCYSHNFFKTLFLNALHQRAGWGWVGLTIKKKTLRNQKTEAAGASVAWL